MTKKSSCDCKKIKENSKESEQKFQKIFEKANDCIIYLDKTGKILDANKKAIQTFGGTKKEILDKNFAKIGIFSVKDIPILLKNFSKLITGKSHVLNLCLKNKKNQKIHLECSATFIKKNDKIANVIAIARDITERKKNEEKIKHYQKHLKNLIKKRTNKLTKINKQLKQEIIKRQKVEEKIKRIFASSPDAITVTNLNGIITDCNQATLKMHGYSSKKELINKNALNLIAKKDHQKALKNLKKTLIHKKIKNVEYTFITKKGHQFPAELSASIIIDASAKPINFVAITKDITRRKQAEEELLKTNKKLQKTLKTERQFLEDISHEIRTPLTIIRGNLDLILKKCPKCPKKKELTNEFRNILTEVQGITITVNELMEMINLESSQIRLDLKSVCLDLLIRKIIKKISSIKNNEIKINISKIEPILILADEEKIKKAILNLINNSIKYQDQNKKNNWIEIKLVANKNRAIFSIKDNGIGISKKELPIIFNRFHRSKETLDKKIQGIGLGLAICKQIIKVHNGSIKVKSTKNVGSEFIVSLPILK